MGFLVGVGEGSGRLKVQVVGIGEFLGLISAFKVNVDRQNESGVARFLDGVGWFLDDCALFFIFFVISM